MQWCRWIARILVHVPDATISGCRALHATKRVMRPSPQTAIVCCGERSLEGGCPAAVRLSASCAVTRVAQRELSLKQSWPVRALGARVRHTPGFSPLPPAVADRRTAAESEHSMSAVSSQSQPVAASHGRPTAAAQRLGLRLARRAAVVRVRCGVAALSSSSRCDGQASPAIASVTADHWRWRAKRPAVVLNLHPDAACGCSPSRLVAGASRMRQGALSPPTRLADVLNLNLPLPPRLS